MSSALVAPLVAVIGVVVGAVLQNLLATRREDRQRQHDLTREAGQRSYEQARDVRDRRVEAYAEFMTSVSGWASLLVRAGRAGEHGQTDEQERLAAAAREFEQDRLRNAQSRFRLLAPTPLVDIARAVTDQLRLDMKVPLGGSGIYPEVSTDYTTAYRQMVQAMRDELESGV